MNKQNKNRVSLTTAVLGGLLAYPAVAQDTISVASYGGAYQDALRTVFYEPIAEQMGIRVREFTLTGITDVRTQVRAGAVEWDVVELYSGQCQQAADEGLLEPLDYSVITNTGGIPDDLVHEHWVGFTAYSTVMAYNTDLYGDNPPSGWADFWDTETFPGVRALSGYSLSTNAEIALMAAGVPLDEIYPVNIDLAIEMLERLAPDVGVWWTSGAQSGQLALNEEVDMLSIWVARIDAAIEQGAPFAYTYDQAILDIECLVVPRGAPNRELAMQAINLMLAPELQANLPQHVAYGPVNADAYDTGLITAELAARTNTSPENMANQLIQNKPYWAEHGQAAQERWDIFIAR